MNIQELYASFKKNENELLKKLEDEKEWLNKMSYFFYALNAINKFKKHIDCGNFLKNKAHQAKFTIEYDFDFGCIFSIKINDKNGKKLSKYNKGDFSHSYELISMFDKMNFSLNENYANFKTNDCIEIDLFDLKSVDRLKKVIFNQELNSLADYCEMNQKIPNTEDILEIKNKI